MINYVKNGDILKAPAESIVCSVTTAGAMAQGLAAQVARAYPDVEEEYKEALAQGNLDIGKVWAVQPKDAPYVVILFPTSREASRKSDLGYIAAGLEALKEVIRGHGWKSIAMPKLGTGVGGLEWEDVKEQIVKILAVELEDVEILIYQ
ncbi:MAG: hypothetical protein JG781_428 [Peptococcaceae bacterium]|jgi:O-acetyl-ADP-ribose deacetylase (regulator of RNase III)|nr:hypothetical protein [Peptococcaceae bacterium]